VLRHRLEVAIRGEHQEVVAQAELSEERIDRADLDTLAAAGRGSHKAMHNLTRPAKPAMARTAAAARPAERGRGRIDARCTIGLPFIVDVTAALAGPGPRRPDLDAPSRDAAAADCAPASA
jgi:hypothetical protein